MFIFRLFYRMCKIKKLWKIDDSNIQARVYTKIQYYIHTYIFDILWKNSKRVLKNRQHFFFSHLRYRSVCFMFCREKKICEFCLQNLRVWWTNYWMWHWKIEWQPKDRIFFFSLSLTKEEYSIFSPYTKNTFFVKSNKISINFG